MTLPFYWNELNTHDFAALSPEETIAILPVASTEQHGPHLPIATDTAVARGMVEAYRLRKPDDLATLVLPVQEIGKANEHIYGPGTLSYDADLVIRLWTAIGEKVREAGVRKMVIVNSHGGNLDAIRIVGRELRVRFGMAVVTTQWEAFGHPPGLIDPKEEKYGIHAGDVETSLMLHFRPDLVHMEKAQDFRSVGEEMNRRAKYLQPVPPHALAWLAHDLNPEGAVGNALLASAEKGEKICAYQIGCFIEMLRELADWPLSRLYTPEA